MAVLSNLLKIVPFKRRPNERGTAQTGTFQVQNPDEVLTVPLYRDHLQDLFTERALRDSRELLKSLFQQDSDVSAAVNAYLTVADTEPLFLVRDLEGNIDRDGHKLLEQILTGLTTRMDYSKGFELRKSLRAICENMRYMALLRGGVAAELVFDKLLVPREIRQVDLATVEWYEPQPGLYRPVQKPPGSDTEIDLNIPTFFVAFYRQDPTSIYPFSPFVSAINTIAARQQVINDLYRIMQKTGYPRMTVKVLEEVLRKNAPAEAQQDENKMRAWLNARIRELSTSFNGLRVDQAFVHFDSVEVGTANSGGPARTMDVSAVVDVLNAQNQAALKTMATVIGRGESGVNTASVEAAIFSMNAEQLNGPIADLLGQMLTFALRMHGSESVVTVRFEPVELRPELELENHKVMRQSRLLELLSHGLISDDQFHIEMFNHIRPDAIPEMSGTGFYGGNNAPDPSEASPNTDPLGRSLTPDGAKGARSNTVQKGK